jgi:hypothetical protein
MRIQWSGNGHGGKRLNLEYITFEIVDWIKLAQSRI